MNHYGKVMFRWMYWNFLLKGIELPIESQMSMAERGCKMEEIKTQKQIDEINRKLDIILEEIELQRKHRREMEDLKEDLMRVGKDFYDTAVIELEAVHDHVNTKDILHLGRNTLREM